MAILISEHWEPDWFDGVTPCPACGHTCYDHCVCVDPATGEELIDPPCRCNHEAHFEGTWR